MEIFLTENLEIKNFANFKSDKHFWNYKEKINFKKIHAIVRLNYFSIKFRFYWGLLKVRHVNYWACFISESRKITSFFSKNIKKNITKLKKYPVLQICYSKNPEYCGCLTSGSLVFSGYKIRTLAKNGLINYLLARMNTLKWYISIKKLEIFQFQSGKNLYIPKGNNISNLNSRGFFFSYINNF